MVLLLAASAGDAKKKPSTAEELTNFLLSPGYSQWLVGPISRIATAEELETYLDLKTDQQAQSFIEKFWEKRGGESVFPTKSRKVTFEKRSAEADKRFTEGTRLGSRTDRGEIYVLYGPPAEVRFEPPPREFSEPIEVWLYPRQSDEGLDGKKPDRRYRFIRQGDSTVLYRGPVRRQQVGGTPPYFRG